jgi:hypothetical protein
MTCHCVPVTHQYTYNNSCAQSLTPNFCIVRFGAPKIDTHTCSFSLWLSIYLCFYLFLSALWLFLCIKCLSLSECVCARGKAVFLPRFFWLSVCLCRAGSALCCQLGTAGAPTPRAQRQPPASVTHCAKSGPESGVCVHPRRPRRAAQL